MKKPRLIVAFAGALVAASLAVPVARAAFPGSPGEIVFASFRTGDADIFSVPANGSGPRNLTAMRLKQDLDPAWSADGQRIAFARKSGAGTADIFVMNADGSGVTRITTHAGDDRQPTWSPDGTRIAFVRSIRGSGTSNIYVIGSNGAGETQLTRTGAGIANSAPSWSPSGIAIAFASTRASGFPQIYVMEQDGTDVRPLTFSAFIDANPDWSPDGTKVAFERCCSAGFSDIYTVTADGSTTTALTATPDAEYDPAWAPDGSRIAYVRHAATGGDPDIHVMNADGSAQTQLTTEPGADLSPSWQPQPGASPQPSPTPLEALGGDDLDRRLRRLDRDLNRARGEAPSSPEDLTLLGGGVPSPGPVDEKRRRVGPGMTLFTRVHKRGPKRVFALRVNAKVAPTIDVALAQDQLSGTERTSDMAKRHGAVAAVNGDFALTGGRPAHAFAEDGELMQTALQTGPNFAVSDDENTIFVGPPAEEIQGQAGTDVWFSERLNEGKPPVGELALFTPAGAGLEDPPAFSCAARLDATGSTGFTADGRVTREHTVRQAGCQAAPLAPSGGVVIAATPGTPEAILLASLQTGERMSLTWSFGWAGVLDSLGGYPLLVNGGRVVAPSDCGSLCGRNPRTAFGVTAGGRVLLVVVDGRQPKWSVGMTLVELAHELRRLGAVEAINLDGGGSSTMFLNGRIKNRPSDGSERSVSSAVLVLRGPDAGDPVLPGRRTGARRETGSFPTLAYPGFTDPASTGGLLDALARGAFGPVRLGPEYAWIVRLFRSVR